MVKIIFPDGSHEEWNECTAMQIAEKISPHLAKEAVAAKVNGNVVDLSFKINQDSQIQILTGKDPEGLDTIRHSSAHLLAQALLRLYPGTKLTIGPVVENGFYYDVDSDRNFTPEDLRVIEQEMEKIVKEDLEVFRKELTKREALKLFATNEYKIEMINEMPDTELITAYQQGEFIDLCRGPHVPSTSKLKAWKLTKVAGAYWRADAKNKQLQRIYGVAFNDKKELDAYLKMMEEAEKRDHRKIGRELDLFEIREEIGPGLIIWLPKGNIVKEELENWAKETEKQWGYQRVTTPLITKEGLFYTSEHLPHYTESMFSPMTIENEKYYIKPMNCPFHHMVFKSRPRSYRELPLRLAEYGWCHRYEPSGTLFGMMRVRGMQMNDAHIYCAKEQAVEEFISVIRLHEYYYKILGITEYWMELSLRDPKGDKYHGNEEMWIEAEELMKEAMEKSGVKYKVLIGGAAFYGPKIDFQIKSAIGKEFTASTNQIDLFMPGKFDLKFTGQDGKEHTPVILHRAPLGTHERFIGFLLEHFAGRFPLWLAPVQIILLPIADRHLEYSQNLKKEFESQGLRVEVDERTESAGKKVRDAQVKKIPLMITLGDKEIENKTLAVRTLDGKVKFGVDKQEFLNNVKENMKSKTILFNMSRTTGQRPVA